MLDVIMNINFILRKCWIKGWFYFVDGVIFWCSVGKLNVFDWLIILKCIMNELKEIDIVFKFVINREF